MLFALLLAAAAGPTAIDAERAFAADAQTIGQWSAFRKWSTDDATMFVPQPANAHEFLKDRKDPPKAIDWWPTASYVSCDGSLAVNTGGWQRADGSVGYFSTVWQKQADGGWKWIVDGGDSLKATRGRPAAPVIRSARCLSRGTLLGRLVKADTAKVGQGNSADGSLFWSWTVEPNGKRVFSVQLYNGKKLNTVIDDKIAAPAP